MKDVFMSDEELVQLYELGNNQAINTLYNRHYKKMLLYLYFKLKDKHIAEDIAQDSFVKVIKYIENGKYRNDGKFHHLLIRITRNTAIDYLRAQNNKPSVVAYENSKIFENNATSEHVDSNIEKDKQLFIDEIISLIDLLKKDEREIVILKHYADLTFKEIATLLDININTALSKMRVALKKLRHYADERGLKPPKI